MNITPCIWFDSEAEDAAKFYVSIFPNSRIKNISKYTTETPSNKPIGSVLTVTFDLDGNEFMTLNGGTYFKVNEAISFIINCKDQKEIDYFYDRLSAVPEAEICGWLKDKYGVSWQLVTEDIDKFMTGKNADKVMVELLKMKRIDINKLREIYEKNI